MGRFGPKLEAGAVRFRLWAPGLAQVELVRPDAPPLAMQPAADGFHELLVEGAGIGTRYMFRTAGIVVPDPASRGQAEDAQGWSLVVPPLQAGRGTAIRPWHEAVIAEIHVGTASPEGSFAGLAQRLPHFRDAGYTAIELMPLADFVGARNWGYDGVLPFAPDRSYGTPGELRALIDRAHALGLAAIVDVVYNHFGPVGNFLPLYAGAFFAPHDETPWGAALAIDHPVVREFFFDNARMWLDDYDADGLRFDAVHALGTGGVDAFMTGLVEAARAIKPDAFLILENNGNEARWLQRHDDGRPRSFTAQWNDDFHHAVYVAASGDTSGYYRDYAEDTVGKVARALAQGFVYQGEMSPHRSVARGAPSAHLPPAAFVAFAQNHDQIGNRPLGDRLSSLLIAEATRFLRFVLMLSPQIPLFFMGEEALVDTPFPFFCDFEGQLAQAIRTGRRREFQAFFATHPGSPDELPDPLDERTFLTAKLDWDQLGQGEAAAHIAAFRELAALRRAMVWPLTAGRFLAATQEREGAALAIAWRFEGGQLAMALNPSPDPAVIAVRMANGATVIGAVTAAEGRLRLGGWSAAAWVDP